MASLRGVMVIVGAGAPSAAHLGVRGVSKTQGNND